MEDTKPKTFVLVLMPFDDESKDVYEVGIETACQDAGAYCERVVERIFDESTLERVHNQIAKADVIVAEMTGRNPNVFYGTGYAHALNKRVVLITQNATNIPFDSKHFPHIVHEGSISTLKSELEIRVRWGIENPKEPLCGVGLNLLELFVNQMTLHDNPIVTLEQYTPLEIGLHNLSMRMLSPDSFNLALIVPEDIWLSGPILSHVTLPSDHRIYYLGQLQKVFPNSWQGIQVHLASFPSSGPYPCILRMFTELEHRDFQFTLQLILPE